MQPCRPGRYINCEISQAKAYLAQLHTTSAVYQLRSAEPSISGTAVYHQQRGIAVYKHYINSNPNLKRQRCWATQSCRPGRYTNRDQQSKKIHGATVYHQRVISTTFSKAKAYLVSGAAVYRQRGKSTAISKAKAYLAQLYINSNHKTKRKHRWATRPCRPARDTSTATSEAKAYRAQLYTNSTVYQPRSAKGNDMWRNCISTARNINRNQRSGSIFGAAVYQQPSKS